MKNVVNTMAHLHRLTEELIEEFACFLRNTPSLKVRFNSFSQTWNSNQNIRVIKHT